MKFKVVAGKRGKFILRWNSGSGWNERTTDLAVNDSNRAKAYRLLSTLESELRGEIPPALSLPTKVIRELRANDDPTDLQLGEWSQFREHFQTNHLNQLSDARIIHPSRS